MARTLAQGLTVVGNLAVDRVDGRAPSPGGCPSFAGLAFARLRERDPGLVQRIVTRCAAADAALFAALPGPATTTLIEASTTSAFALDYDGEDRRMTVTAVGDPWTREQLAQARITTSWVHAAPLLRDELPLAALAAIKRAGHRLSFDGQGLVRAPRRGPLALDDAYDPAILAQLDVLKLAEDEASVIAHASGFTATDAVRLGVPEILITYGSAGADVYLHGAPTRVAPRRRIGGVHTTGSGDIFAVAYAAARASGTEPATAAQAACEVVAEVLERRRDGERV